MLLYWYNYNKRGKSMSMEKMKMSKTTVYDLETVGIINANMEARRLNFSQSVNFLIKSGDYLIKKMQRLDEEKKMQIKLSEGVKRV